MTPAGTPDRVARSRGCLLGGAIGDALGAPVEFWTLEQIRRRCGPAGVTTMLPAYGQRGDAITDDTQMTLFTVEGLLDAGDPAHSVATVHAAYLRWYRTQTGHPTGHEPGLLAEGWLWSPRAPGTTCLDALAANPPPGTPAVNDSKGCGTIMRSAPFGFTSTPIRLAAGASFATHGHPTAAVSAAYLANTIALLVAGHDLTDAVTRTHDEIITAFPDTHHETTRIADRAAAAAKQGPPNPETVESFGGGWVAEEALAISLLVALTATDWRDALTRAVTHSGDSDSTGAIVGNILGAHWGDTELPADWLDQLEGRSTIERLAAELADARR